MLEYLIIGLTLGSTFALMPSPLLALTISETLKFGKREGIIISLTPLVTDIPIITAALAIMSSLSGTETILAGISFAGALFLLKLSIKGFQSNGIIIDPKVEKPESIRKGIITNFLNPNPYIFWFTVGSPTIIAGWKISPSASISYITAFFFSLIGIRIILTITISHFRKILSGKAYRIISKVLAGVLFLFAAKLAYSGFILLNSYFS